MGNSASYIKLNQTVWRYYGQFSDKKQEIKDSAFRFHSLKNNALLKNNIFLF